MTGRQANSRAEIAADGTPAETPADRTAAEPITAAVDAAEEMWKQFEGLPSLRTVPDQGPAPAGTW